MVLHCLCAERNDLLFSHFSILLAISLGFLTFDLK